MAKITYFIDVESGFVKYLTTYSSTNYEDFTIIDDTFTITVEDEISLKNGYYFKDSFKKLPEKPSQHHIWNLQTEQWEEPEGYLQTIQSEAIAQVNQLSSEKILPKYPSYLQLNLPYDFGQDSPEVREMRAWIDNIRILANTAKSAIASATTLPEITTIVANFKTELGNIA